MKLAAMDAAKKGAAKVSLAAIAIMGLSACATVDLSQVAIEKEPRQTVRPLQNVVELASAKLTSVFTKKGWCKSGPKQKTMTATNVLLNGIGAAGSNHSDVSKIIINPRQLSADLKLANEQVLQTTKAAEVFLVTAGAATGLDNELSLLETALLSAREAETRFGQSVKAAGTYSSRQQFETLQASIGGLKTVTDAYGDRIRANIASAGVASTRS